MQYGKSWDKCLPYAEFSYNNSYQESLKMHRLRCSMVIGVKLRCFRARLENRRFSDLTSCKKSRRKFIW
jgi:hypothetical protein